MVQTCSRPFGSHYSRFLEHWKQYIVIGRSAANLADPRKHREVGKHKSNFVCLDLVIWSVRVTLITLIIHPWTEDVLPSVLDSTAISTCQVMDWLWWVDWSSFIRTGQEEDTIRKDLMRDNFMSAEEAWRFCCCIVLYHKIVQDDSWSAGTVPLKIC